MTKEHGDAVNDADLELASGGQGSKKGKVFSEALSGKLSGLKFKDTQETNDVGLSLGVTDVIDAVHNRSINESNTSRLKKAVDVEISALDMYMKELDQEN